MTIVFELSVILHLTSVFFQKIRKMVFYFYLVMISLQNIIMTWHNYKIISCLVSQIICYAMLFIIKLSVNSHLPSESFQKTEENIYLFFPQTTIAFKSQNNDIA
jgi:hypothetical protein